MMMAMDTMVAMAVMTTMTESSGGGGGGNDVFDGDGDMVLMVAMEMATTKRK